MRTFKFVNDAEPVNKNILLQTSGMRLYEIQDIIHLLNHKNTASINPNEVLCIKTRKCTKINVRISLHDNVNL